MLKPKHNSIYQLFSYFGTLIIYIASIIIGAYAASKLATPYVFYETSINWVQTPTKGLNSSLYSAITTENSFGKINEIQFNALSNWNTMTGIDGNDIAFMPTVFTSTTQLSKKFTDVNGLVKWKLEKGFNNINMLYLNSQCGANTNVPCDFESSGIAYANISYNKENQMISWLSFEYPSTDRPRDEYLSQVLLRKNELTDAKELIDDLFNALKFKSNSSNFIFENTAQHMYDSWDCKQDVTCAKNIGAVTTVKFVGAILETAFLYTL
ncbi:hypothetical protein C2G38_2153081 [Gigaspora rosea]|uniref:Uncharacterized protein n=1 Tax=Gigaspora rosea TaxID=44941 RepID=A0A397W6F3_9GLOM|nr:hypothetical protein C2G38_2153081 [Gigaspora rosea]